MERRKFRIEQKKTDIWGKLQAIGGLATAVIVAIIGGVGSFVIHDQQEKSNRSELFTQLMSQRENAESAVRKDMFQQILSSFLKNESGTGCLVDEINEELLRLDLLSRNFHEMLDMEPLFMHVLLKIVREIPSLKEPVKRDIPTDEIAGEKKAALLCEQSLYDFWERKSRTQELSWKEFKHDLIRKDREKLTRIAKRITRKQMESLSSVQVRYRFTVDLAKTCQDVRPSELNALEVDCERASQGKTISLALKDIDARDFTVLVNRSYPDWNQIKVKVSVKKTKHEMASDINGKESNSAEFWLGYFDFPLAENTFISDKERYSVILDDIDAEKNIAEISLLYFPAAYAGLKEKSFYQQKLISTLLEEDGL